MSPAPELILHHGLVHTMAGDHPAQAIAIRDGVVSAVGRDDELLRLADELTATVDLRGRVVIPGFTDAHNHALETGANLARLQLASHRSLAGVLDAVAAQAAAQPAGTWIVASSRWHESRLAEQRLPTRAELDAAAPQHPVFVPRGGHLAVANSAALERAGIALDAADPAGGHFGRDETGVLDGLLLEEGALAPLRESMPPVSRDDDRAAIATAANVYLAEGITAVRDPWLSTDQLAAYAAVRANDELRVRTTGLLYVDPVTPPRDVSESLDWIADAIPRDDPMLRFGGIKLVLDGGIEAAALREPYASRPDDCGTLLWSDDRLEQILALAAARRLPLGMHVVGDAALDQALRACAHAAERNDITALRWCLEHVLLATPQQIQRIAELGLLVTFQLPLLHELAPAVVANWGPDRAELAWPVRSLMNAGVRLAAGSDSDVGEFRPLDAIAWSVTRATSLGRPLGRHEALDAPTAVRYYTAAGPYVTFEEHRRGTLQPGKLADLVILDGDPLEPGSDIGALSVVATYSSGRRVSGSDLAAV
jgi:predicted amidohydrolase YtcJ